MADKLIVDTGFLALINRDNYIFARDVRAQATLVAILPFRDGDNGREYLARVEICPAHSPELEACSITGGLDAGETIAECIVHELQEEAGYQAETTQFIPLGTVRPSKAMDTTAHLFAIDVTRMTADKPTGDNTPLEQGAGVQWVNDEQALQNKDPLFISMIARLSGKQHHA